MQGGRDVRIGRLGPYRNRKDLPAWLVEFSIKKVFVKGLPTARRHGLRLSIAFAPKNAYANKIFRNKENARTPREPSAYGIQLWPPGLNDFESRGNGRDAAFRWFEGKVILLSF